MQIILSCYVKLSWGLEEKMSQEMMFAKQAGNMPGILGNRGTRAFISGEQRSKLKATGEQR